jgi:hypothetical protein
MPPRARPFIIASLAVAAIALVVGTGVFVFHPEQTVAATTSVRNNARSADAGPINARSVRPAGAPAAGLLDGVAMTDSERQARANALPVAVMVDNYIDARPQYGLDKAEIVYEALVEAGITRFMAVYWRNDAARIEPVRSARTQFLGMVSELDAVYTHVGAAAEEGPANATAQIRDWGIRDVDEDMSAGAIRRDGARVAPHNAMTSTDALRSLARNQRWTGAPKLTPWQFKADGGAAGVPVATASMNFDRDGIHRGAFTVGWQYEPATNTYLRSQAGKPHTDAGAGAQLSAKNVVLHIAEVRPAGDRSGHVLYKDEGTGKAIVLLDGVAIDATWQKDSRTGRTRYLDTTGKEVAFNRGATWVEMLPIGAPIDLK